MAGTLQDLGETHIVGPSTREWMVSAEQCPTLAAGGLDLTGWTDARSGSFAFVRLNPTISQVLACVSGEGQVWLEGEWQTCRAGQAYLTPAGASHGYRALRNRRWHVCWAFNVVKPGRPDLVIDSAPRLASVDAHALFRAISGLYHEAGTRNEPVVLRYWVDLVRIECRRMTGPIAQDHRLFRLWQVVDSALAQPWTLDSLADQAGCSGEHLRRLCQAALGRSPMKHVTYLRMQRAAAFLSRGDLGVAEVARHVGYQDPFAFSTAFKRWTGQAPSAHRRSVRR